MNTLTSNGTMDECAMGAGAFTVSPTRVSQGCRYGCVCGGWKVWMFWGGREKGNEGCKCQAGGGASDRAFTEPLKINLNGHWMDGCPFIEGQ